MPKFRTLNEIDFGAIDEYTVMVLSYLQDSMSRVFGDERHFIELLKQYVSEQEEYYFKFNEEDDNSES